MAKKRQKRKIWVSVLVILLLLLAAYFLGGAKLDLVKIDIQKEHSVKLNGNIIHNYNVTFQNFYYYPINLHLELPQVWRDQGVNLNLHQNDFSMNPFQKKSIRVTLESPEDLIEDGELNIDIVKSIERGRFQPIIGNLSLPVSSLADAAPLAPSSNFQ